MLLGGAKGIECLKLEERGRNVENSWKVMRVELNEEGTLCPSPSQSSLLP